MEAGCCASHGGPNTEGGEVLDPTMSECCLREAIEQRKIEAAKARLREVDVSMKALDMREQVFPSPCSESLEFWEGGDSDDDPALKDIWDRRIRELQEGAHPREQSFVNTVTTLKDAKELGEALGADRIATIVHVAVPSSEASCFFDEMLDGLAFEYSKTRCLRLVHKRHDPLDSLRLNSKGPPSVACFRDGSLVGHASLASFCWDGEIAEEKVMRFFRQLRILKKPRDEDNRSEGSSGVEEEENPWFQDPCHVCGRRYPHQHFGPPKILADGSGSSDDDSGKE